MENPPNVGPPYEDQWREILTSGPRGLLTRGPLGYRIMRSVLPHLPSNPRCKNCYVPFGGFIGRVVGVFGFAPSRKNPTMCDF